VAALLLHRQLIFDQVTRVVISEATALSVALGGVMVCVLGTEPKIRGFKPGRGRRIFKGNKIRSTTSFGGEVKPTDFSAC
jgi:hypothetical protein